MAIVDIGDTVEELGQMATEVKIAFPMSHIEGMHLKSEIAQRELSDLGRRSLAL